MVLIDNLYSDINNDRIELLINFILEFFHYSEKEISVSIVDDDTIKFMNFKYRNINQPTDVLSFALLEEEDDIEDNMLGDIVISFDTALKQSNELNHPLYIEIDNLIVHGMLHLLGYDHIDPNDKEIMFFEHKKILEKFYINNNCEEFIKDKWLLE